MRRVRHLGIPHPLVRVLVWLLGTAAMSMSMFAAGVVGLVLAMVLFAAVLAVRLAP